MHTYPGCGCDVPTHLYSYSFARNPNWTRLFPKQREILDYLKAIAGEHGVTPHVRLGCEIQHARWDEAANHWCLDTSTGALSCDVLVSAIGATGEPDEPEIPGLKRFAGHRFHSARWDWEHDLSGERVGVIGTGPATAQFVPKIRREVERLTVFQRTPPWVLPHFDRQLLNAERWLYRLIPQTQELQRQLFFAMYEACGVGFRGRTELIAPIEAFGRRHLRRQVADPVLREKLTPRYRFGCKRPILSNSYYPALASSNVDVVTEPIVQVNGGSLITADEERYELDTLITAIGYRYNRSLTAFRITGCAGRTLGDVWDRSPRAYLGTTVPGFPNFFILLGPNSIGINSVIYSLESQIAYVIDALRRMDRDGVRRVELRPEALAGYVRECDRRSSGSVWTDGGCKAYYTDDEGRNFALYPGFVSEYRRRTRRFDPRQYVLERVT